MTPTELKALIESDDTAAALLLAANDAGCADRCNQIAPAKQRRVPNIEIKRHAILSGYWPPVTIASERETQNAQLRGLALSVGAWINDVNATTDFELPEVQAMIDGLVTAGLMTAEQSASLLALGYEPEVITAQEVEFVRTRLS